MRSKAGFDTVVCVGLFLAAALVRLLFLTGTTDRDLPFSIFYYGDSRIYREFALTLIRGGVFDQGVPIHPPAFAYVLSWIIGWVGERPFAMRAYLAIGSATVIPMTYLLGRALWSRAVGVTAALLATFSFGLCVVSVSANAETLYIPLLVAQALLCILLGGAVSSNRTVKAVSLAIASGAVLGLGALTRTEHLGLAVVLPVALAIGWPFVPRRRIVLASAAIAGVALCVILPWTIRNHTALTRFNAANPGLAEPLPTWVPVTASGPIVFALANNPRADGTFQPDTIVAKLGQGQLDLRDPEQADLYLHGYRRGWEFLTGNRQAAATLLTRKLALASDAHALGFGLSNWPAGLTGTRRAVDLFVPDRRILKPVFWILLAVGAWVLRPVWRRAGILWLISLQVIAVSLATFGYARFFVQFLPFVFLFQAAALDALTSKLRSAVARQSVAWVGAALAVALTVELAVANTRPLNFEASGSVNPETGKIAQDAVVNLTPAYNNR